MKKILVLIFFTLLCSIPAMAIEYVSTNVDGSKIFRCEYEGKEYKVKVKDQGNGTYLVLRHGMGATSFSGIIASSSHTAAASRGCGEK